MPKRKTQRKRLSNKPVDESNRKTEIAEAYVGLVRRDNFFPSRADLLQLGITRDHIRSHFGNISKLRMAVKEMFPQDFDGVLDIDHLASEENLIRLQKKIKKHKRLVITTAVNGQPVHEAFLNSIAGYCKRNDALLLVIPCHDPAHNLDNEIEWHMDGTISDCEFVFEKLTLNSNIHISSVRVTAKQMKPTTQMDRFVQAEGSMILGSPKQSLEYVPVSNVKFPHALMSTGAVTLPNYTSTRGNSLRTAFIAEHDHIVGGVILEIQDDKIYHFRQIQADEDGSFADLGLLYSGKKVSRIQTKIVLGDYHAGEHDQSAEGAWLELQALTKADEIIVHDLHNGISSNHHDEGKIVTLARRAGAGKLDVVKELEITGSVLNRWTALGVKVTVVRSNHDEFLHRWVERAAFAKDPLNFKIGCQLAAKWVDGTDPLIYGIELHGKLKNPKLVNWLDRDQDYRIAGIECGAHGDLGANGSRGSRANLERSYGRAVIAHSHSAGILRGIFQVGTTSLLKLDYNRGPSSWIHCSCLLYANGQRQLINSIEGNWHLK